MKLLNFFAKKLALAFVVSTVFVSARVAAQTQGVCGSDEHYTAVSASNPNVVATQHQMDAYIEALRTAQAKTSQDLGQEIVVPICFHIIHNNGPENISDAIIEQEVAQLNTDYNELNADTSRVRAIFKSRIGNPHVTFKLVSVNPWGQCTNGIDRVVSTLTTNAGDNVKPLDWWDSKRYLNVWVVNGINSAGLPPGEQIAGYSEFPWSAVVQPYNDGVVIGYNYVGKNKRVLTHEIGHYFGLYHPFQDSCSLDQNLQGDHIADTPPVAAANFNWSPGVNSCHTDTPDLPDLIEDYMDYASLPCMFTTEQVWRLRAFAFSRAELISIGNADTVYGSACTLSAINENQGSTAASVSLFPNPANGTVTLQIGTDFRQTGSIRLVDVTGKTVYYMGNIAFDAGRSEKSFTRQELHVANGVYFFKVVIGSSVVEQKVVFAQ